MKRKLIIKVIFGIVFIMMPYLLTAQQNKIPGKTVKQGTSVKNKIDSQPLITSIFTADPSAHVFNGKIFIYPSHDIDTDKSGANGDHFDMKDYHVLSMDSIDSKARDNGIALSLADVPWASRQLWAPDAVYNKGIYYLYFPAKDKSDIFRIGVATSKSPIGPFKAQQTPIKDSFSIDPCVFKDSDGSYYMYFGGIWGGQLQMWSTGVYDPNMSGKDLGQNEQPAITGKVAKLTNNMLEFSEKPKDVVILDKNGEPLLTGDHDRRFFEGTWVCKYNGKYYFTYSTGDTHQLCYAIGTTPYGPFTYKGIILKPVLGWTTHHSIIEFKGEWYLFYHDTALSGKSWLRNVKIARLHYLPNGEIETIDPQLNNQTK